MCFPFFGATMRKYYYKASERKFNLDWIDDEWLWLFAPEPIVEEIPAWTEQEILHICDGLLEDSLKNLFDGRSSMQTLVEIYNWIISMNDRNPFSFNNCCKLSGLDSDVIRETVLNRVNLNNRKLH
jgi:hypothetical protein